MPAVIYPLHTRRKKPLVIAVLGASLALQYGLVEPLLNPASQASAAVVQKSFVIGGGPLGAVLSRFSGEAGVVLSFDAALTAGRQSNGLKGTYSVDQGFAVLLSGTSLAALRNGDGSYSLVTAAPAGTLALGATTISGQALGESTEGTAAYTTGVTRTATKLPLSLRETPQSVSVITRQLMDDQNLSTINDVLKFTPGITTNHRDSDRYTFYARGFAIQNFEFDGVPTQMINESQQYTGSLLDMAIYDHVEVLRGATGLMSGAGQPSATVNLVRKRPTREFQGYLSAEAGAWDKYRTEADVSGPLTDSGNVRGRFVAAYEKQNSFIDWYKQEKRVMYGALDVDLNDDTVLKTSLDYQNNDSDGVTFGHIPLFNSDGSATRFSRSFNPAARWSYLDNTSYTFNTALEHKLTEDWTLKTSYTHQYAYRHGTVGSASGGKTDPLTGSGNFMFVNRLDSFQTQDTVDVNASGPFSMLGREHDLVVGVTSTRARLNFPTYDRANPAVPNIYEWDGNLIGKPYLAKLEESTSKLQQTGIYGALRLKPTDDLSIILGSRLSWWNQQDSNTDNFTGADILPVAGRTKKTGVVTPYAGIVYDLDDTYSVYASYTSIFQPQPGSKNANNGSLPPLEGDNYEIGIKGEYFDGALNASLAVFEVQQNNFAEEVGYNDETFQTIYRAISGTTTRGVETEVAGEVATGWNVFGGYTYRESKDKDGERIQSTQPMNLFKLGTTYRLQGDWSRLTVGGNASWQSSIYQLDTSSGFKGGQGSYALVGLLANYEVNSQLTVGLNLDNLFDKKYYDGIGTFNSASYGAPRNAMVSAKWKF